MRRGSFICSRQSGKSLITAVLALWSALYGGVRLVVMASPSWRQSAEMIRTIKNLYAKLEEPAGIVLENLSRIEFSDGARIIGLPASPETIRGLSGCGLCILDEAAHVDEPTINSVRPMMATVPDARLVALSTPAGRRGKFYDWWTSGEDWHRVRVTADQVPRISREFLEIERREMGEARYRQEYFCEFAPDQNAAFLQEYLQRMIDPTVRPLWPDSVAPAARAAARSPATVELVR